MYAMLQRTDRKKNRKAASVERIPAGEKKDGGMIRKMKKELAMTFIVSCRRCFYVMEH